MHRHGAYILDHGDAPGFTLQELHRMSQLVLGQRGKLRKIEDILDDELFAKQLLCLRLAVLLCHARKDPDIAPLQLSYKSRQFKLVASTGWARSFPQSAWLIDEEVAAWQKSGWRFSADLG
jgi:exopolyphosphatase/guanosine-5'-triphosphate,3'-diphosphate pyrophosphatase